MIPGVFTISPVGFSGDPPSDTPEAVAPNAAAEPCCQAFLAPWSFREMPGSLKVLMLGRAVDVTFIYFYGYNHGILNPYKLG